MKLISVNVNGRVRQAAQRQQQALLELNPDVLALQEVTLGSYASWVEALTRAGYSVLSTINLVSLPYPDPPYAAPPFPQEVAGQIERKYFNLVASRYPQAPLPGLRFEDPAEARLAFPEKHLATRLIVQGIAVDLHCAHLPPGASRGLIKVHAFEAIRRRIDEDKTRPRILCGDFNAPWDENDGGPMIEATSARWPDEISRRWAAAEGAVLANPEMKDAYRDVHTQGEPLPASHFTGRKTPKGHRYDYVFRSKEFETQCCRYVASWLARDEDGVRLSDHAPVEAVFKLS